MHNEIYLLRQYAETYRIQQRQLELAYLTIDSSLEALQAPTPPGSARSGQDGPAALTQQLLSAQRSLPAAQNALLTLWISYLDARLQLYRDLELMPLDARGVWIDEIRECDCSLNALPNRSWNRPTAPRARQTSTAQRAKKRNNRRRALLGFGGLLMIGCRRRRHFLRQS